MKKKDNLPTTAEQSYQHHRDEVAAIIGDEQYLFDSVEEALTLYRPAWEDDNAKGHWVRGGFVIEYGDEFRRKVSFSLFGEERCQQIAGVYPGTTVQVDYQPESREFNDRWYTDLQCFKVTPLNPQM